MREIDPRDCQHGYADSQQEEIDRLHTELKEAEGAVNDLMTINGEMAEMLRRLSDRCGDWCVECNAYCSVDMRRAEVEIDALLARYDNTQNAR